MLLQGGGIVGVLFWGSSIASWGGKNGDIGPKWGLSVWIALKVLPGDLDGASWGRMGSVGVGGGQLGRGWCWRGRLTFHSAAVAVCGF